VNRGRPSPRPPLAVVSAPARVEIERASSGDLMQLAVEESPTRWHAGAILMLETTRTLDPARLTDALDERLGAVPRLRQRLRRTPVGCGRPVWVDDPGFDVRRHVRVVACPSPGDEGALLDLAARVAAAPLPADRPRWSLTYVTGLAGRRSAVILVFHHVLADGMGGLGVLAHLVDGAPIALRREPKPPPSRLRLAIDAATARLRAVTRLRAILRRLRDGFGELGAGRSLSAPRSSLNRPTGPQRRLAMVEVDLEAVRSTARAHGGTVNDVLLTAVTGALRSILLDRGEVVDSLVVSVIVSGRRETPAGALGNEVGAIPVSLPLAGEPLGRLEHVAAVMDARKRSARGASAALMVPAFRLLGALRVLHRLLDRQQLINTIVTNIPGPSDRLSFLGMPITRLIPLTTSAGNITVSFAALSYAGTLTVTAVVDPDHWPDLDLLVAHLQRALDELMVPAAG
jgi:diacylglycerol O-acyltransferase / wax synthase